MSYDPAQDEEDRREREEMERYYAQAKEAQAAYRAQWPNHCKRCGGWGLLGWTEAHGERFEEPCDDCVAAGLCPRCGAEGLDSENPEPCPTCGWNNDEGLPSL